MESVNRKKKSYTRTPTEWLIDSSLRDAPFRIRITLMRYTTVVQSRNGTWTIRPSYHGAKTLGKKIGWSREKVSTNCAILEDRKLLFTDYRYGHSAIRKLEMPSGGPRDRDNRGGWSWTILPNDDLVIRKDLSDAQFRLVTVLIAGTIKKLGGCKWSIRKLALKCGWSSSKVDRIISQLVKRRMIENVYGTSPDSPAMRIVILRPNNRSSIPQIQNTRYPKRDTLVPLNSEQPITSKLEHSSPHIANNVQLLLHNDDAGINTNPTIYASTECQHSISAHPRCARDSLAHFGERTPELHGNEENESPVLENHGNANTESSVNEVHGNAGTELPVVESLGNAGTESSVNEVHGNAGTELPVVESLGNAGTESSVNEVHGNAGTGLSVEEVHGKPVTESSVNKVHVNAGTELPVEEVPGNADIPIMVDHGDLGTTLSSKGSRGNSISTVLGTGQSTQPICSTSLVPPPKATSGAAPPSQDVQTFTSEQEKVLIDLLASLAVEREKNVAQKGSDSERIESTATGMTQRRNQHE